MIVKSQVLENGKNSLNVEVTGEMWANAQAGALKDLKKNLEVPGFRKGNVPDNIAESRLGLDRIFDHAIRKIIDEVYRGALEEAKLTPVTRPNVSVSAISKAELKLEFVFFVKPDFTLGQYRDLEVQVDDKEITDEMVDKKIDELRQQNASLSVMTRPAELGDVLDIDFVGYINGEKFEGGEAKHHSLTLGSKSFIPGFEEQLVGATTGEEKEINIQFPENYHAEFAGKAAMFKVKVHEVSIRNLPAVNDELAIDSGIEGVATLDGLRAYYRDELKKQFNNEKVGMGVKLIVDKIMEASSLTISDAMIDEALADSKEHEHENHGHSFADHLKESGETEAEYDEKFRKNYANEYKNFLVFSEIAKAEKLEVTEDEIEAEYLKMANLYNVDVETIKKALEKDQDRLEQQLFNQKIVDFLKSVNTIK